MALPDGGAGNKATVIFNACKGEKHHTSKGFKQVSFAPCRLTEGWSCAQRFCAFHQLLSPVGR